ncbi:MAG: ATP-grasp domain-containing protein [Gammaproteobacteria bacterium]
MSAAVKQELFPAEKHIINHDIMHCTADGVVGNHLYSGRALGISEPDDLIQLTPELEPLWDDIKAHYERVGLSYCGNVIWDVDRGELGRHIGYKPSVFFFGMDEYRVWGDHKWLEAVRHINSKNNFMAIAQKLGVDVPNTLCFNSVQQISLEDIDALLYPCYLKAAISVAGVGIYRCEDRKHFLSAVSEFDDNVPVQIQEEVRTGTFLNLQYQVVGKELVRLAASEQILDGFSHQGNRVPASHAPWESVDPLAQWLLERGIKGIFAFDIAVVETGEGPRFPAIECNPRFNGASYPTLIAGKLGIPEWSAVTLKTSSRRLSDIDLSGLEYDGSTGRGVVLVNWGTVLAGKLVALLAGPREVQEALAIELRSRL